MSISYSAIVGSGSGKATLPTVQTWNYSTNILRDPPKSITTRKIDRVGQTSEITQMIQESGDRFNEAIQVYARGVDPFQSVNYGNYGNMGGQRGGGTKNVGLSHLNNSKQSYLPYRIMNGGAFRPPIRDQRDLLPLSRLPRVWTSQFTQPGFADFSKKAMCPSNIGEDYRGVKTEILRPCARPTATYKIQTPIVEPYEVKNVIKNPLQVPANSGINIKARFNGEIGEPVKQVHIQPLHADARINQRSEVTRNVEVDQFDTDRYTHDSLQGQFSSNPSQNIQITSIEEIFGRDTDKNIQDRINVSYTTPQKPYTKYEMEHCEMDLERVLPYHQAQTNMGDRNTYVRMNDQSMERVYSLNRPMADATTVSVRPPGIDTITSRQYQLKPTITAGSFDSIPTVPTVNRENNLVDFDNDKTRMRQRIYDMQQDRAISIGNIPYEL